MLGHPFLFFGDLMCRSSTRSPFLEVTPAISAQAPEGVGKPEVAGVGLKFPDVVVRIVFFLFLFFSGKHKEFRFSYLPILIALLSIHPLPFSQLKGWAKFRGLVGRTCHSSIYQSSLVGFQRIHIVTRLFSLRNGIEPVQPPQA